MWGTFGGDTTDGKTNPIRKYYVVTIVIIVVSIAVLFNLIQSNTSDMSSGIIETGIDKVPFEEADDFFNDPNIDWEYC